MSNEFSSQTEQLTQAIFTFNESLTTNLTDFMQGLQDLFVCASSSQDQSSWQTEPVPDPVYTRILATIERYAAAHPGPDPAHYRCGSNHPQYIGSDDPQIISMLQHDDYNWEKGSPVINNLPYWDIPNQGDTCRNGQYTEVTGIGIIRILITLLSLLRLSSNYCARNVGSGRVEGHPGPYNLTAREKPRFHVKNKWWVSTYGWDSHCSGIKTLVFAQGLLYSLQTNVLP